MSVPRVLRTFLAALASLPAIASAQTPTFSRHDLQTGLQLTERVLAGDFNGDGRPDLVVTSHSTVENYGIYLITGRGDGTFDPPALVLAPAFATSLGAADANGDGVLDLVMLSGDHVWTLLGAGDGTFRGPILSPPVLGAGPPLLMDVSGDGSVDLVIASHTDGVSVSLGHGDGTFGAPTLLPIGGRVARVRAGDADADGNVDLLAGNIGQPDAFDGAVVTVLFGAGDGAFDRRHDVPVAPTPLSLAVLDVDGDGAIDIAASSYAAPILSVARGGGDGTFLPASDYPTAGAGTADTVVADFNGDGRPDIAICGAADLLSIFTNADGTLAPRRDVPAASSCNSIAIADFDLDGRPDLALNYFAGSGTVSIFSNTTAADAQPPIVTAAADPAMLWPAHGRAVAVTVSGTITDDSDVDLSTLAFTVFDEYGLVQPSGTFTIDEAGRYAFSVMLTAERRGDDRNGRTYTIAVGAADRSGNEASASLEVLVAHDRRGGAPPPD